MTFMAAVKLVLDLRSCRLACIQWLMINDLALLVNNVQLMQQNLCCQSDIRRLTQLCPHKLWPVLCTHACAFSTSAA